MVSSHCLERCFACCIFLAVPRAGAASAASLLAGKGCSAVVFYSCVRHAALCCGTGFHVCAGRRMCVLRVCSMVLLERSLQRLGCLFAHILLCCMCVLSSCFVSIAHTGTSNCRHMFCTVRMHYVVAHSLLPCCRPLHVCSCASTDAVRVRPYNKSSTSWVMQMWLHLRWAWFVLRVCVLLSLHRVHPKQARRGVLNCHNRRPGTCAFMLALHCPCCCCKLFVCKQLGSCSCRAWACPVQQNLPEAGLHEQVCCRMPVAPRCHGRVHCNAPCVGVSAMLPHNARLYKGGATCLGLHWLGTLQQLSPAASFEAALSQLCCL